MESIIINNDIKVYYIEATAFPEGIVPAFQQLFSKFCVTVERNVFGISRPENGRIAYFAAAEEKEDDELLKQNLPFLWIAKGEYISLLITDFRKDNNSIRSAFEVLTAMPDIDRNGYCIEWYQGANDVLCMVKINP